MHYDIIPLLALLSSFLSLTVNIIGKIYNVINKFKGRNNEVYSKNSNNDHSKLIDQNRMFYRNSNNDLTYSLTDKENFNELDDKNILKDPYPTIIFLEGKEGNPSYL